MAQQDIQSDTTNTNATAVTTHAYNYLSAGFYGVSTTLVRACKTLALCSEKTCHPSSPGASMTEIIYKMRDLEAFEGGILYRTLLECLAANNDVAVTAAPDEDYDSPTAYSTVTDDDDSIDIGGYGEDFETTINDYPPPEAGNDEERPPQRQQRPSRPLSHRQRAKRAFLSAVFIEGSKKSAIEDLRETLRRHYVLGKNPFGYDEHVHEATAIGTKTIPNILPSLRRCPSASSSVATSPTSNAGTSIVVLFYYVF